jgi:histidyl-tRNA synthetase
MDIRAPRGMQDVLPDHTGRWQRLEAVLRDIAARYDYREIRTPVLEHTEVFQRGVGAGTDIVDKEMYTFTDRGGRSVTLRAEGTAPVMRAVLEHSLAGTPPVRLYYICPIFRYDRPQAGRYRQHTQFGAELIGSADPAADAEVLSVAVRTVEAAGLRGVDVRLSSVGDAVCRPGYETALRAYYAPHLAELCEDCRRRFDAAPMRLLDCKRPRDRELAAGAPRILDHLCDACRTHFAGVRAHLDAMGMAYTIDPLIVRGLNYYTRTAFEAVSGALGAQNVVFGGGRYDGLAEQMGGASTPGVGFGMGLERLLLVLEDQGGAADGVRGVDVFVATAGTGSPQALAIADRLRAAGIAVTTDVMGRALRAQMRQADRAGAAWVLLLGEDEVRRGAGVLREMAGGEQVEVPLDRIVEDVAAHVRRAAKVPR